MCFSKIINKNLRKIFIYKFHLIIISTLFIYLSVNLKDKIINPFYKDIYNKLIRDNFFRKENMNCDEFDPIVLMAERFKKDPVIICESEESIHIC